MTTDLGPPLDEGLVHASDAHVPWRQGGIDMGKSRGFLYKLARILGDVEAVKKGRVGKRVGRRATGKASGRLMRKLFR